MKHQVSKKGIANAWGLNSVWDLKPVSADYSLKIIIDPSTGVWSDVENIIFNDSAIAIKVKDSDTPYIYGREARSFDYWVTFGVEMTPDN